MTNEKIIQDDKTLQKCAVCDGDIIEKPVKKMGNFYCSIYCAEVNRERMENLDMEKLDFNELGDVIGKFMNTCQKCVMPIQCRKVRSYCASYFDELHEYITMHWCCHALFGLSAMLSDGTVKKETVLNLLRETENYARINNYNGVNPNILAIVSGELLDDLSYTPGTDVIPPEPKEEHEHYLACVNCDRVYMDECVKLTAEAETMISQVEKMIDFPYCGHMKYDLAHMLLNPKVNNDKVKKLIEKTKNIVDEKKFRGGQYRIHLLAAARSMKE